MENFLLIVSNYLLLYITLGWEEPNRRGNDEFSDWDGNRGNETSNQRKNDDDSSDLR